MIHRCFVPPNFRCRVRDASGHEIVVLKHGAGEAAVRESLAKTGYGVVWIEPYDFAEWLKRAQAETEKAEAACAVRGCREGGYRFREEIWKEIKLYLFDLFESKCAYCESSVLTVGFGEVEHYRPKAQVEECPDHPGYYWLAYDPGNLLPSCQRCNGYLAKMNRFPVRDGFWARCREEMGRERPLLLNPYVHEPREHLRFLPLGERPLRELSVVQGITDEGRTSVEVYQLNRPNLQDSRAQAQMQIRIALKAAFFTTAGREIWQRLFSGDQEYSSAALAEAEALLAELTGAYQQEKMRTGGPAPAPATSAAEPAGRVR